MRNKQLAKRGGRDSELARLRDALKPFAYYYDLNDCKDRDPRGALEVPIDDLRRAKAALNDPWATIDALIKEVGRLTLALEQIVQLDECSGHELTVKQAFDAVAIAASTLRKHPSAQRK